MASEETPKEGQEATTGETKPEEDTTFYFPLSIEPENPKGIPEAVQDQLFSRHPLYQNLRSIFLLSRHPFAQGGVSTGSFYFNQERIRHIVSNPYTIHPHSDFVFSWKVFLTILLTTNVLVEPWRLTFYFSDDYASGDGEPTETGHELFHFFVFTSLLLLLDMLLTFVTGYVDVRTDIVVLDFKKIASNYLKTLFIFDLVTRFPLDYFYVKITGHFTSSYIRYFAMWKTLRIFTLLQLLSDLMHSFMLRYMTRKMISICVFWFYTTHWFACIQWLVPDVTRISSGGVHKENSWIVRRNLTEESKNVQYFSCYLRSLGHMLQIGMNRMAPTEQEEMTVTILNMLVGMVLAALFISTAASLFTENERADFAKREMVELVDQYMKFRKVPKWLKNRVDAYYDKKLEKYPPSSEKTLLGSLSFSLSTQIRLSNCENLFDAVPMFKNIPQPVKIDLISRLEFEVYLKGDMIIQEDNVGDVMFFIEDGTVDVLTPFSLTEKSLGAGDFFGEMALITKGHRLASVVAKTDCDVYRLMKKDFEECLQSRPAVFAMILKVAKDRLEENERDQEALEERIKQAEAWKEKKSQKTKEKRKELADMRNAIERNEKLVKDVWDGKDSKVGFEVQG